MPGTRDPHASLERAASEVRLVPLGGLGEIGMNCLAVQQGGDVLVIDCGIRFPHDDIGVDVVHPDFTWLLDRAEHIRGVFLTHGHEDHIGGLPYLLNAVEVPVYGPPHAIELARRRLLEHGFEADELDLRVAATRKSIPCGAFEVEPVRVAHSIVEATALAVGTRAGTLLHSGDFNFDPDPPDGEPTDEERLGALGREGVAVLLSDSTNVDVAERGGSEREVGRALHRIISNAPGRVVVALFASNIQRLILLGEIAEASGRKICTLGRSLDTQVDIVTGIGRLKWPSDLRVPPERAKDLPGKSLLVLAGGTQGEPGSAMSRLALGSHSDFTIGPEDTVVFSSRVIPGNDLPFGRVLSGLLRSGARVITWRDEPSIHASGHASRAEQSRMIHLTEPHCFLPVHGTLHHLIAHGELAKELGVRSVAVVENGTPVIVDGDGIRSEKPVKSGEVHVGFGAVPLPNEVRRERVEMARFGVATVAVFVDRRGALLRPPSLVTRGIPFAEDPAELRAILQELTRELDERKRKRREIPIADEIRRIVRRELSELGGVRPMIDVHVLGEDD